MKKFAFLALAASAVIATPAMAQNVTGTITLNGNVASKCSVSSNSNGTTFAQTVNFGELSQANGTLRNGLDTDFTNAAVQATVVCNTGTPKVSVDANPMVTGTGSAPTGYANTINYTANVAVSTATPGTVNFSNATTDGPLAATAVGAALANSANNVKVTASGFGTPGGSDILVAGAYTGNIIIVISPT
jgi:hypothetical protein